QNQEILIVTQPHFFSQEENFRQSSKINAVSYQFQMVLTILFFQILQKFKKEFCMIDKIMNIYQIHAYKICNVTLFINITKQIVMKQDSEVFLKFPYQKICFYKI
ncbi:hypothetical protein pb186bvf_000944, partial [Paramecium bursaria]